MTKGEEARIVVAAVEMRKFEHEYFERKAAGAGWHELYMISKRADSSRELLRQLLDQAMGVTHGAA